MSMNVKIKLEGEEKLARNLEDKTHITNPLHKFLSTLSKDVVGKVTRFTPVKTGLLRASWKSAVKDEGKSKFGVVSNDVFYAGILENSSPPSKPLKPHAPEEVIPFLKPAVEWIKENMDIYNKQLKQDIEKEYKV